MKIYTIESGSVQKGALVSERKLSSVDVKVWFLEIGEEGRGRRLERVLVDPEIVTWDMEEKKYTVFKNVHEGKESLQLYYSEYENGLLLEEIKKDPTKWVRTSTEQDEKNGNFRYETSLTIRVRNRIETASFGLSKSGKTKLVKGTGYDSDQMLGVFRTKIGYRGGNGHGILENGEIKPIPAEWIVTSGVIAQGGAGAMGSGSQPIIKIPKPTCFVTSYSGRLYGGDEEHFYIWDGNELKGGFTKDEFNAYQDQL